MAQKHQWKSRQTAKSFVVYKWCFIAVWSRSTHMTCMQYKVYDLLSFGLWICVLKNTGQFSKRILIMLICSRKRKDFNTRKGVHTAWFLNLSRKYNAHSLGKLIDVSLVWYFCLWKLSLYTSTSPDSWHYKATSLALGLCLTGPYRTTNLTKFTAVRDEEWLSGK